MSANRPAGTPRRVVILGAGFGGLSAARELDGAPVEVAVVDRRNHHLFQPLLYQVATASLSPGDIAYPIRSILRRQANVRVLLAEAVGIDAAAREVRARRRPPALRLPHRRDRRAPRVLRPRRMGAERSGAQDARGRHRDPPTDPPRLREGRARDRSRAAPRVADVRPRRRRADGRRARRGDRRDRAARARLRLPLDRPARRAHRPGGSGTANPPGVSRRSLAEGAGRAGAHGRRGPNGGGRDRHRSRRRRRRRRADRLRDGPLDGRRPRLSARPFARDLPRPRRPCPR